jgi:hypothetical protein
MSDLAYLLKLLDQRMKLAACAREGQRLKGPTASEGSQKGRAP